VQYQIVSEAIHSVTKTIDEARPAVSEAIHSVTETVDQTRPSIVQTANAVKTTVEDSRPAVNEAVQRTSESVQSSASSIADSVQGVSQSVKGAVQDAQPEMTEAVKQMSGDVQSSVTSVTDSIQNVAQNTASRLTSDIGTTNLETAQNAFDQGIILSSQDDFAGAEKAFTEVIQIVPEAAEAHFNLGIVLLQLNRKTEGIGHIQQARDLSRSHGDFEATENLDRLLQQLAAFARGELSN